MTGLSSVAPRTDWRSIVAFVALAVVLSTGWAWWASSHALLKDPSSSGIFASVAQVGVLVSAIVTITAFSRGSFKTIGWRLGAAWAYPVVFLVVSAVILASIGVSYGLGYLKLAQPLPVKLGMLAISAPFMLIFTCLFSFCEEFGWRGFLLLKLLPLGVGRALLITGMIWFVWEAPLVWFGMLDGQIGRLNMALTLGLHFIQNIAIAVAFGYLRLRFGSVFLPAFAHGLLNALGGVVMAVLVEVNPILGDFDGPIGTAFMAAVGLLAWTLALRADRQGRLYGRDLPPKII